MMNKFLQYKIFLMMFLLVLLADQASKYCAINTFFKSKEIIPNVLYFSLACNTGAAWSIFSGYSVLLGVFGIVVLIVLFGYREKLELNLVSNQMIYGLLCGGILGNVIDRICYGYVIDFIDVYIGFYRWPTFNIADVAIFISIFLYFVIGFFQKKIT